jgi:hypothetical protein
LGKWWGSSILFLVMYSNRAMYYVVVTFSQQWTEYLMVYTAEPRCMWGYTTYVCVSPCCDVERWIHNDTFLRHTLGCRAVCLYLILHPGVQAHQPFGARAHMSSVEWRRHFFTHFFKTL